MLRITLNRRIAASLLGFVTLTGAGCEINYSCAVPEVARDGVFKRLGKELDADLGRLMSGQADVIQSIAQRCNTEEARKKAQKGDVLREGAVVEEARAYGLDLLIEPAEAAAAHFSSTLSNGGNQFSGLMTEKEYSKFLARTVPLHRLASTIRDVRSAAVELCEYATSLAQSNIPTMESTAPHMQRLTINVIDLRERLASLDRKLESPAVRAAADAAIASCKQAQTQPE